jgi:PEP-CTERM motif-containing protein
MARDLLMSAVPAFVLTNFAHRHNGRCKKANFPGNLPHRFSQQLTRRKSMRRIYLPLHMIVAVLFVFACNSEVLAGPVVIKITNTSDKQVTLSDLIVFSVDGVKQTRLKPGDPSDDIIMKPKGVQLLDLDFNPNQYVFSTIDETGEPETKIFNHDVIAQGIKLLKNANNGAPLFLSIDMALYTFVPPADGTILSVSNGVISNFPGWFVGMSIDLENGNIFSPFTGSALVDSTLEVETIPEPATLLLLSSGIAGVAIRLRRRKVKTQLDRSFTDSNN